MLPDASHRKKVGGWRGDSQSARWPRVSRLLARAIRLDRLIRDGIFANREELAQLVTSPASLT